MMNGTAVPVLEVGTGREMAATVVMVVMAVVVGGRGGSGLASVGNLTRPCHATTKNYRYTSVEREGELYINTCLTIWSTTRASLCCTCQAPARFCAVFLRCVRIAITVFFFVFFF